MNFIIGLLSGVATAVGGALVLGPTILVVAVVGWIAATLSGLLLSLGGLIVGAANSMQALIVSPQNAIVTIGWTIVRDIANLGFVLVIIVIAFATILRLENYGAKKLLPRLILAAILVNFSLQIGAFIIGFSQVITDFFFTKISLSPGEIGSTLLGAFGPQRFLAGAKDPGSALAAGASIAINLVMGPWLATAFNLIMLFTILVLAFMLIIRFLALSFLLVIAPITWLFFVIPALAGQFSKWWNKFLQWTFFAPATSFFVYLSFTAAQGLGELWGRTECTTQGLGELGGGAVCATLSGLDSIIQVIFMDGVNVILLSGFLIGGLIVAQQMSITGAGAAVGWAKKIGTKARGAAAAYTGRKARQAGAATLAKGIASKPGTAVVGWMQRTRGFKKVGMALGSQSDIMRQRLVDDADGRLKKYGDVHLAKNIDALSNPERIAALERLAKNDTISLLKGKDGKENAVDRITADNEKLFKDYGRTPRQWGAVQVAAGMDVASADALRRGPAAVDDFNKAMEKWIKSLKPDQIAKLPVTDIFSGDDTLSKLGFKDEETSEMYRSGLLGGIASNIPSDIAKLFNKVKGAGFDQLYKATTALQEKFEDIATDPAVGATEQQVAEKRYKGISKVLENAPSLRFYSGMYEGGGAQPPPPPPPATP